MKALASTIALFLACSAPAQTEPASPAAPPAQPESIPTANQVETIDEALARARAAYQAGPLAEQVVITIKPAVGPDRTSTITLRLDAPQRRLYLDLTRLAIAADDHAITAQAPHAPDLTFTAPVSAPLSMPQLWNAAPPVLLPQLEWALGSDPAQLGRVIAAILHASWLPAQHTLTGSVIFEGEFHANPASIEFDKSGRLSLLSIPLAIDGPRLDLSITPLDPAPGPWTLPAEGRTPVPSIADLRVKPAAITPGARLPALSFMTRDLDAWPLQEALAPSPFGGPTFGLLIFYKSAHPSALADAQTGARAASSVANLLRAAQPDPARRPHTAPAIVALMSLNDMTRTRLAELDAQWPADSPPRVFSPNGAAEMDRIAQASNAALLVIDADQKLLAAIPLDNRPDAAAIAQEAAAAITAATRFP